MSDFVDKSIIDIESNKNDDKDFITVVADPVNDSVEAYNVSVERKFNCICNFICFKKNVVQIYPLHVEHVDYDDSEYSQINHQETMPLRFFSHFIAFLCRHSLVSCFILCIIIVAIYYS
jgi:hypothetical protein